MDLIQGSIPGVMYGRYEADWAGKPGRRPSDSLETVSDVYVTNSRLTDVFSVSGAFGKLIPALGCRARQNLTQEETAARTELPEELAEELEAAEPLVPAEISLFDFSGEGVQRWALVLTHDTLFRVQENVDLCIRLRTPDGESLAERFADPERFRWSYQVDGVFYPFSHVGAVDGALLLRRDVRPSGSSSGNREREVLYRHLCGSLQPITETITLGELSVPPAAGSRSRFDLRRQQRARRGRLSAVRRHGVPV